jgi:hypothetical protein
MRDRSGYRFDDNLTLALLAGGTPPQLAPGFWAQRDAADQTAGEPRTTDAPAPVPAALQVR